jgi:hypothetical protein
MFSHFQSVIVFSEGYRKLNMVASCLMGTTPNLLRQLRGVLSQLTTGVLKHLDLDYCTLV